jgi:hypothetical protein
MQRRDAVNDVPKCSVTIQSAVHTPLAQQHSYHRFSYAVSSITLSIPVIVGPSQGLLNCCLRLLQHLCCHINSAQHNHGGLL